MLEIVNLNKNNARSNDEILKYRRITKSECKKYGGYGHILPSGDPGRIAISKDGKTWFSLLGPVEDNDTITIVINDGKYRAEKGYYSDDEYAACVEYSDMISEYNKGKSIESIANEYKCIPL